MRGVLIFILIAWAGTAEARETLDLSCRGEATWRSIRETEGTLIGTRGAAFMAGSSTQMERGSQEIRFHMDNLGGKLRLPPVMVPPGNTGSGDGWWILNNFSAGEKGIIGYLDFNGMDAEVEVNIDRVSGELTAINPGKFDFRGNCEKLSTVSDKPKF